MSLSTARNDVKYRGRLLSVCVFCVIAIGFVGWRAWRELRLRQFAVVKEGVLYRSGQLTEKQLESLVQEYGLKTVINLRTSREPYQKEFGERYGLNLIHVPMGHSQPITKEQMAKFLSAVDDPKMWPVLVHCSQGETRTGAMVAVYRRQRCGWTREQALEEMRNMKFSFVKRHEPMLESALAGPDEKMDPNADLNQDCVKAPR